MSTCTLKFNIKYDNLHTLFNENENELVLSLNEIYTSTADELGLRVSHKQVSRNTSQPEWWDAELDSLKKLKTSTLNTFWKTNDNHDLLIYLEAKRKFRTKVKVKKNLILSVRKKKLIDARKNPKLFWKILRNKEMTSPQNNIPKSEWHKYFSSLFDVQERLSYNIGDLIHNDSDHIQILNSNITENEMLIAVSKIKPSKAPGPDGIF